MDSLDYYKIEELLTEEERRIRDRAAQFVQEEVSSEIVSCHRAGKFPDHLIPRMGALRFYAPYLKEHGCAGLSYTAYGLIMQELERADSGVRSLASVQGALAIQAIHSFGSPEQHAQWLPGLVSGERVGMAANAGSAMHRSQTSKLFGRGMTTAMSADSWLRRTRPDFARATSRGSSV
jgi:glutaryl-CoA dehydrogenase